jgi:hypothetical protein
MRRARQRTVADGDSSNAMMMVSGLVMAPTAALIRDAMAIVFVLQISSVSIGFYWFWANAFAKHSQRFQRLE